MTSLSRLVAALRASRGFAHKRDIGRVLPHLGDTLAAGLTATPHGDDCAVLPDTDGSGHLLLAIEGFVQDFVEAMPWFAGYSGVMVNLSDIAAMGGRPLAVVDALWSDGAAGADELLAGMRAASERYGVPLVGGHTNLQSGGLQLAVAVLGRARRLISSFAAQPGDRLLMAIDLRGRWHDPYPFWDASTEAAPQRLREDLALLPELAEAGLCDAGKDISMAGVLGTVLMLLECSKVGARIDMGCLPLPAGVPDWYDESESAATARLRWLCAFPSYGYVLSVRPALAGRVIARFRERGIACGDIGEIVTGSRLNLVFNHPGGGKDQAVLWDLEDEPFITGLPRSAAPPPGGSEHV